MIDIGTLRFFALILPCLVKFILSSIDCALFEFSSMRQSPLEKAERLEQLRALEAGVKVKALTTDYESISVETPADLERVRDLFARRR